MAILYLSPYSLIPPRRTIRASQDSVKNLITKDSVSCFSFCPCGRRHFLGLGAMTWMPFPSSASKSMDDLKRLRPPKPEWYEELFAWFMDTAMESYEKEISGYKMKLLAKLVGEGAEKVLEVGVGTGPNFKYYTAIPNVSVVGVDPNAKMESYARKSAAQAGLKTDDFRFIHALGESIPLEDASVDAVVGTLVLCSVTDITQTLSEIKRILKPGGIYLFIEHVAAEDGSFLRLVQNVLDPLQQVVADGCHLTRDIGESILEAGFNGGADIKKVGLLPRGEIKYSNIKTVKDHCGHYDELMTQVHSSPSLLVSLLTYSPRRDHVCAETLKSNLSSGFSSISLCSCKRKHFLEAASLASPFLPIYSSNASHSKDVPQKFHPESPDWYKDLFSWFLTTGMQSYEAEIAEYKRKLFHNLT